MKEKRKNEDAIAQLETYAAEGNLLTEEEMKVTYIIFFFSSLLLSFFSCT